jgi:hypothetical protein
MYPLASRPLLAFLVVLLLSAPIAFVAEAGAAAPAAIPAAIPVAMPVAIPATVPVTLVEVAALPPSALAPLGRSPAGQPDLSSRTEELATGDTGAMILVALALMLWIASRRPQA